MNFKYKLFSILLIFALFATTATATPNYITPEKFRVTEYMNNYCLNGQNNSLQLACEIGQYVSEEYGWNCDIRQLNFSKHTPVYINVFYPAADNKKGYQAYYGWFGPQRKEVTGFWDSDKKMYYRDWYEPGKECYVSGVCSYGIVKSYFGNVTEENESTQPEEYTSVQDIPVVIVNDSHDEEKLILLNSDNNTVQSVDLDDNEINNTVENSTNTVNNQGVIDSVKQYFVDLKNADLSNVTFNFWGN